jgi:hypothetical protein
VNSIKGTANSCLGSFPTMLQPPCSSDDSHNKNTAFLPGRLWIKKGGGGGSEHMGRVQRNTAGDHHQCTIVSPFGYHGTCMNRMSREVFACASLSGRACSVQSCKLHSHACPHRSAACGTSGQVTSPVTADNVNLARIGEHGRPHECMSLLDNEARRKKREKQTLRHLPLLACCVLAESPMACLNMTGRCRT